MSVRIILYGKLKEGLTEAWNDLAARMTAVAKDEEGTIGYKWYVSADGSFINEDVYTDEAAFLAHIGAATESGQLDEFVGNSELAGVWALDPVNDEMREALGGFGAVHYGMIAGF